LQNAPTVEVLSQLIITELSSLLVAGHGTCFIRSIVEICIIENKLLLMGSFAYRKSK
jgi:hypothetical protein